MNTGLCDAEDLDNGLQPCGRQLCEHGRCHLHGGCERCEQLNALAAATFESMVRDAGGKATPISPAAIADEVAEEAAHMSRIYGGAGIAFGKSEALRSLIEQHDGPVTVMGYDPAKGPDESVLLRLRRPARVIEGAHVLVIVAGEPLTSFARGVDLTHILERRLPPLDFDPKDHKPIRVTMQLKEPVNFDRLNAAIARQRARQSTGYRPDPLHYADGHVRSWCNPPTRPTTIESPIPRPVVPPAFGLVVRRRRGKSTPQGWGLGKGAHRHGVGSRRDIARMTHQRRVRAIVARIARGAGMFQVNHALV